MPTRRTRRIRKRRLKGGIPFIPGTKTVAENIHNCEEYWSVDNHIRGRCRSKTHAGVIKPDGTVVKGDIDYPGRARQLLRYFPTSQSKTRTEIQKFEW